MVLQAQNTKDKAEKTKLMNLHKSFGVLAAGLLGPRLLVRFLSKSPGHVVGSNAFEKFGATAAHVILYGFAIGLPVSGVVMGMYSGFGLPFFSTSIPSIRKDPSIAKPAYEYHKLMGQAFEWFVPLHVGGALVHVAKGHTIFARILPLGQKAKAATKVVPPAV